MFRLAFTPILPILGWRVNTYRPGTDGAGAMFFSGYGETPASPPDTLAPFPICRIGAIVGYSVGFFMPEVLGIGSLSSR